MELAPEAACLMSYGKNIVNQNSSVISRLLRHWHAGTLFDWLCSRLRGRTPVVRRVRWFGADTQDEALLALGAWAVEVARGDGVAHEVVTLGEQDAFHKALNRRLRRLGVAYESYDLETLLGLQRDAVDKLGIILVASTDTRRQTQLVQALVGHSLLGGIRCEYVAGLDAARKEFIEYDEYPDTHFVSPVLLDDPAPYTIYRESLKYFQQKCGFRDYLDLYQILKHVVENGVEGDIAEFGSYRGHSGWLIAKSLQALGSNKRLFMFDMFEAFPQEDHGVDQFWSQTHDVDFTSLKAKFADLTHVTFVKGDFTQTLAESDVRSLALAYVDCDSYRATRYLLETFQERYLTSGAAMICEDYGHPALLGNRIAVHEVMDGRPNWFRYFSQFSGLYIMVKT